MRRGNVRIRKLETPKDYLDAEQLQRTVWHFPDREIIPLNELVVAQKIGGYVFGAFDGSRMVSFCFGIPGFRDGRPYHYSRMLGVLPKYRDLGLGLRMKLEQRRFVLRQGLDLVRWTFDPLQGRNASLNIGRLGCIVREYVVNIYAASQSRFNRGIPTDRFMPEWQVASRHVRDVLRSRRKDRRRGEPVLETHTTREGWLEPFRVRRAKDRHVHVEIPESLDRLKQDDLKLALRWRGATRRAFLELFRQGYVIHDFVREPFEGRVRSLYLLERGFSGR